MSKRTNAQIKANAKQELTRVSKGVKIKKDKWKIVEEYMQANGLSSFNGLVLELLEEKIGVNLK